MQKLHERIEAATYRRFHSQDSKNCAIWPACCADSFITVVWLRDRRGAVGGSATARAMVICTQLPDRSVGMEWAPVTHDDMQSANLDADGRTIRVLACPGTTRHWGRLSQRTIFGTVPRRMVSVGA